MTATFAKLPSMSARLALASRRFHAWWEGYAFDEAAERAALQARLPIGGGASGRPAEEIVAEAIWGAGRLEPGSPAYTMRYARMLGLPVKANVVVFGAGAGGPLNDLDHGTRWKVKGFTRSKSAAGGNLKSYGGAMGRMNKSDADAILSFFQLSGDANPAAFAEFAAEFMDSGAKAVFADFAVVRKGARLSKCFPAGTGASPKTESEYRDALRAAGFVIEEAGDDTAAFMPLVAKAWSGWRRAYDAIRTIEDATLRADMLRAMADHARLWAERYEALKSGQLRILFMRCARR